MEAKTDGHLCRPAVQRQEYRYGRTPESSFLFLSLSLAHSHYSLLPYTHIHNTPIYGLPGMRMDLPRFPDPPRVPSTLPALRPSK